MLLAIGEAVTRRVAPRDADLPLSPALRQSVQGLRAFRRSGPVDCVFVGSSSVRRGLDPIAYSRAHAASSGREARCFNFSVVALDNATAVLVARAVEREFEPEVIVIGLMPVERTDWIRMSDGYRRDPWVRERAGGISATRRALMRSALYRRVAGGSDARRRLPASGYTPVAMDPEEGFAASRFSDSVSVNRLARPARPDRELAGQPLPERAVLLLMPVHPHVERWVALEPVEVAMNDAAARAGRPAFSGRELDLGVEYWADPIHLNPAGAARFSGWLGTMVAGSP